jgi:hypothetical protein
MRDESIVEVVNRTTEPLNFTWDGVPGVVPPGYRKNEKGVIVPAGRDGQPRTHHLQTSIAEIARRQNVKSGSEDRWTGEVEMLIGVAVRDEEGTLTMAPNWIFNDISYTEKGTSIERFNRESMGEADRAVSAVPARGFPRGRGAAIEAGNFNEGPIGIRTGEGQ